MGTTMHSAERRSMLTDMSIRYLQGKKAKPRKTITYACSSVQRKIRRLDLVDNLGVSTPAVAQPCPSGSIGRLGIINVHG